MNGFTRSPVFWTMVVLFAFDAVGSVRSVLGAPDEDGPPVATDPRLVVELFAVAPEIVHPIALDFDSRGRLLVVESHTHFRPANYAGPAHDRIRAFEDTDGDGRADRITTFFEETDATMDLAVHRDGSIYLATRNELLRLRDRDGDGHADERTRLVFLETEGNYPHNGLSGLVFDSRGDLLFGMGENLGSDYRIHGADGVVLSGGGEGGNVFACAADGSQLRRVATGFWNPFGAGRDIFGTVFVADNDPDSSPPCRLLQLVEGGDYGFQFRYGRAGRHPFQSWNGELPGTLPMVAGTGESPCEVICYESDGLPADYLGQLLVPVWADHRVERFIPRLLGAGTVADRKTLVVGGKEFRPSGLAVAPDGSLFISDWVSRSYELHGLGAVWHVRARDPVAPERPSDPKTGLASLHRPLREDAARRLAESEKGRTFLAAQLQNGPPRARAAALTALVDADDRDIDLMKIAREDDEPNIRAMAARALVRRRADVDALVRATEPTVVRAAAVAGMTLSEPIGNLQALLGNPDPYLRHAAIQRLGRNSTILQKLDVRDFRDPRARVGVLLAARADGPRKHRAIVAACLRDPDPEVRLLATKWVSDERLVAFREQVAAALQDPMLDPRGVAALTTTLARLDDQPVNDDSLAGHFLARFENRELAPISRLIALRAIPATHPKLRTESLIELLGHDDESLRMESLRAVKDRGDAKAADAVQQVLENEKTPTAMRAQALLTLVALDRADADLLIQLAGGEDATLAAEALRGLNRVELDDARRAKLESVANRDADRAPLVNRILGKPFTTARPAAGETQQWLGRIEGPADAEAGRRVFEHPRLAGCFRCHRVEGRGADIGPDLSLTGRNERRSIVDSILRPGALVAPHFQVWRIELVNGQVRTGMLIRTHLDETIYVDEKGERFQLEASQVAEVNATRGSIMPEGLLDGLTDQEIRDLIAYLALRK